MSIVERALRRLQNASQGRPREPGAVREPRQARSAAPSAHVAPVAVPALVPKQSLPTSIESLRAAGVLPLPHHADVLADQFRRIKWPLLESVTARQESDGHANSIMVTSSVAGEGKTFTSLNLALSIAWEKDFSVLLVDADVAKRHTTCAFGADEYAGLTDILSDPARNPEDAVLGTSIRGLTFLPAGQCQELAPEMFASQRMVDVIRTLCSADPRRIVLFDTSPLLSTNESQVLGRLVDQVVLVVRAESTTQPMVLEAVALLDRSKEVRCILNQARASELTEYYYGYVKTNPYENQQL